MVTARRAGLNVYFSLADESITGLLHAAAHAAERLASSRGKVRTVRPARRIPARPCPCPKCAEAQKVAHAQKIPALNDA